MYSTVFCILQRVNRDECGSVKVERNKQRSLQQFSTKKWWWREGNVALSMKCLPGSDATWIEN